MLQNCLYHGRTAKAIPNCSDIFINMKIKVVFDKKFPRISPQKNLPQLQLLQFFFAKMSHRNSARLITFNL